MKVQIELDGAREVEKFTQLAQTVDVDVRLVGKDENGNDWNISAKSLYASLIMSARLQKKRAHTAHDVDWNTIYCECEKDIYCLIRDFVKD